MIEGEPDPTQTGSWYQRRQGVCPNAENVTKNIQNDKSGTVYKNV